MCFDRFFVHFFLIFDVDAKELFTILAGFAIDVLAHLQIGVKTLQIHDIPSPIDGPQRFRSRLTCDLTGVVSAEHLH